MAINVDTVYQKVLAIANKEQRGYITPQEFNLFADKSQKEIFDNYFHDYKTLDLKPKTNLTHGDDMEILEEKISIFKKIYTTSIDPADTTTITSPSDLYRIKHLWTDNGEATQMDEKDILITENHPLTKATKDRPIYYRNDSGGLTLLPTFTANTTIKLAYYRQPVKPEWAYVVVQDKALYNSNLSQSFELHASEEELLVAKILQLSGVVTMKMDLIQAGGGIEGSIKEQQND